MDGFSRILEKKLSELLCTRLYINLLNTSYLTDSYIVFTLKMESVSKTPKPQNPVRGFEIRILIRF